MSVLVALGVVYLAVGVALVFVGPLARRRRRESLVFAITRAALPRWKRVVFDGLIALSIVVLWGVFLLDEAGSRGASAPLAIDKLPDGPRGLRFQHMGGVGQLSCDDCGFSQRVLSHTHGFDGSDTSGYQCQSCGALHAVDYEPAFRNGTPEAEALFSRFMVNTIERQMAKTPREEWLRSWEPELAQHRRALEGVAIDAIAQKQAEASAAFEAKLVCPCGGRLSREEVVSCPSCRGRNLSYRLQYIT